MPKLTDTGLFLGTAGSIAGVIGVYWPQLAGTIALLVSPLVFLSACVLLFFRPRFAYGLALTAGLMALSWFVRTELEFAPENSWVYLNTTTTSACAECSDGLALFSLRILSMALVVIAIFCSLLRLLPARWLFRNSPFRLRTWPAFTVSLLGLAVWFVYAAIPYRVPRDGCTGGVRPDVQILHVEKHGFRFREAEVSVFKDGKAFVWRHDRRPFHYRSDAWVSLASLPGTSRTAHEHALALATSPQLWALNTPPANGLRSWNAEGWYIRLWNSRLNTSRLLAFAAQYGESPPQEVTDLFHEIEELPARETEQLALRDVCLGFCYNPLRARGVVGIPLAIR